ncbi:hypothetical protein [Nocardioides litoris]|uniref:hypothetical protein n=1 Tax=Nocardioides litoris TaxID=1926648 RepID=UPI0011224F72|nr:hypothetical protein [Nocardioides litoris]
MDVTPPTPSTASDPPVAPRADREHAVAVPEVPEVPRTSGGRRSAVLLQAVASISTLLQMVVFAMLLGRRDFDDYSVWITVTAFLVGLGQAVGVERVLVGRRTFAQGLAAARVLGLAVALAQLAVAVALGNLPLALCSVAVLAYVGWDFARFASDVADAAAYLKRDVVVLVLQVAVVAGLSLGDLDRSWLPLAWWGVGAVLWTWFTVTLGWARAGTGSGLRSLWEDRREAAPLLLDAALAGVPLVVALALARAQGSAGDASEARLALTLLGPVTVLGLAARRLVYRRASSGRLDQRGKVVFAVAVLVVLTTCAVLLALTRTPLYGWVLPGFVGLSWAAVLGFATNHGSLMAVMLPAAYLRAEGRSTAVGVARLVATLAGLGTAVLLMPVDSPADVAWSVAAGSLAYMALMWVLLLARPRPTAAGPTTSIG